MCNRYDVKFLVIVPQVGPAQRHKRGRASINVEVHTAPTLIKALPPQTGEKDGSSKQS